jgi:DNA polymerase III alpha subunit
MIYNKETERILPHPSGIYLEPVPVDELTGGCAFDYEYGDANGYMKVDILTNKSYDMFRTKDQLISAIEIEPDWTDLLNEDFVAKLPHIAQHFDVVRKVKPTSVEELADLVALIRPAKIQYIQSYLTNKKSVRRKLYLKPMDGGAYFKKSHAIAYALMIVAVMNKLKNSTLIQW